MAEPSKFNGEEEVKKLGFILIGPDEWLHQDTNIVAVKSGEDFGLVIDGTESVKQCKTVGELHETFRRLVAKTKKHGR